MKNITFAERLKEARKSAKLSQDALAKKIGRTKSTISRWESGERNPKMFEMVELENALGVSAENLMYGTSEIKTTTISEINRVSSKLSDPRQVKVLNFSEKQLEQQQGKVDETAIYKIQNIKKFDDSDFINVPFLVILPQVLNLRRGKL